MYSLELTIDTKITETMYSPDGETLGGKAGISAGSEGVAIKGNDP